MMNPYLKSDLHQVSDVCNDLISIREPGGRSRYINSPPGLAGAYTKKPFGHPIRNPESPDTDYAPRPEMRSALNRGESWKGRVVLKCDARPFSPVPRKDQPIPADHNRYWAECSNKPIHGFDDTRLAYVHIQPDIRTHIEAEKRQVRSAAYARFQALACAVSEQRTNLPLKETYV